MKAKITILNPKLRLDNENYEHRKYNILKILDSLPAKQCKSLKKNFPDIVNVSRIAFARWLNASITDTLDIPATKLAIIANVLEVPIESLFNIMPKPAIKTNQFKNTEKSILESTGLVL